MAVYRGRAVERFARHIERWLEITRQRLHGDEPIPRISPQTATVTVAEIVAPVVEGVVDWPAEKMVG
jgi:hypothetical protein